jgi:hypothetical protein
LPEDDQYDEDEAECIIANLIFKKLVKGYISHEKKKVVFSDKNAFPNIHQYKIDV